MTHLKRFLDWLGVESIGGSKWATVAYPQTWHLASRFGKRRWWNWRINRMTSPLGQHLPPRSKTLRTRLLYALCAAITGHEMSKTESGYGGGRFADKWCRWCNKRFQVPLEEVIFSEEAQDLIDQFRDGTLP